MIDLPTGPLFMILPVCFVGGLALGFSYFYALRTTTNLIVDGGNPLLGLGLTLGRLIFLGAGLFAAVLAGGFALLAALAGVLCAKGLMLRLARSGST